MVSEPGSLKQPVVVSTTMSYRCSSCVAVARTRSVNVWMLARPANAYASQLGVGPTASTDVAEIDRRRFDDAVRCPPM